MKIITRDELKRRLDDGWDVPLVEVLAPEYFREFHLPGAINVPFDERFAERVQETIPDKGRPIVVYCMSKECTASEEAGKKMEELGYTDVFDYEDGKVDWKDAGLPVETEHVEAPT